MRRRLGTSLYAGLLFTVLGLVAWATGQPFVFPSLGPSAFVLAFDRRSERERAVRVVGSHLIGGLTGLAAWTAVADGAALTATPPAFSAEGFRLTVSAVVSLGLLSTTPEVAIIVAGVTVLVAFHAGVIPLFKRFVGDAHPLYGRGDAADGAG
ncbi:hypothetical protein [Halorubrum tebenquichense]|uniref:HPP family protein n=1 Tax=Halorubrum tebenquichense DSM 14210 TaxID=1227485 RepID=M0DHI1_9EURY|nr:hypothetical protein [Halorubrum tebenquichense]ELZ34258.1 hypothetical protein C472_13227 [Halorubrum tebenquichense DSM 14210]